MKPLHYGRFGWLFCAASEAQQILAHPDVPCRLEERAVADFLANNVDREELTMFQGIRSLPAGHWLLVRSEGERLERYWPGSPPKEITYKDEAEYARHFRHLIEQAVADRLRDCGSVVGVEVSGGMDSTSIAAVAQLLACSNTAYPRIVGCSYYFDELAECDERKYSQTLAAELGLEINYVPAERFWLLDDADLYSPSLESPFMSWESLKHHNMRYFRQRGARVFFSGHFGEIVNQGSPLVYADRFWRGDLRVLGELKQLARVPYSTVLYKYALRPVLPRTLQRAVQTARGRQADQPPWLAPVLARQGAWVQRPPAEAYLPWRGLARQDILQQMVYRHPNRRAFHRYERLASSHGLERRLPFLDRRLADFVLAIPPAQMYQNGVPKWLLRQAMKGILPETIRLRFDKTIFHSYNLRSLQKASGAVRLLFANSLSSKLGFVLADPLNSRFEAMLAGDKSVSTHEFLPVVNLELWLRKHANRLNL
jgi:asparagine synthase (glutamine-hydrolysing)